MERRGPIIKCEVSVLAGLLDHQGAQPSLLLGIELVHEWLFFSRGTVVRTDSALVGACVPECRLGHGGVGEWRQVAREGAGMCVGHAVALAGDRRLLERQALRHRGEDVLAVGLHEVGHARTQPAVVWVI